MTEDEGRAYLESVWEYWCISRTKSVPSFWVIVGVHYVPDAPFNTEAEARTAAVAYTQKLMAEIAELQGDIFVYVSLMTERAISSTTYNALLHAVERAETLLAEKRAGMKEGK